MIASASSVSYYETVAWYSASSFQWSLAWTLLALLAVEQVKSSGRLAEVLWSCVLFSSAICAPASCALGVLTAPLAAIWAALDRDLGDAARRIRVAAVPLFGLLLFVGRVRGSQTSRARVFAGCRQNRFI